MMVTITFVEHGGAPHAIEADVGTSLMKAAVEHGVPGIDGDCGGACACATCHVYVPEAWRHLTGSAGQDEKDMLECAIDVTGESRLGCQILVVEALAGLVVHMPASQR